MMREGDGNFEILSQKLHELFPPRIVIILYHNLCDWHFAAHAKMLPYKQNETACMIIEKCYEQRSVYSGTLLPRNLSSRYRRTEFQIERESTKPTYKTTLIERHNFF